MNNIQPSGATTPPRHSLEKGKDNNRLPTDTFVEDMLIHIEHSIRINEPHDFVSGIIADLHERLMAAETAWERMKIIQNANALYSIRGW